jgi:GWxTD domain-containing protein
MRVFLIFFFASILTAQGQALRDINYNYLYNGSTPFAMSLKTVRTPGQWITFFELQSSDTTQLTNPYTIEFETRKTLFEKEGVPVSNDLVSSSISGRSLEGEVRLPVSNQPVILVARVINTSLKRAWFYYSILEPRYPEVTYARENGKLLYTNFTKTDREITFAGNNELIVSYYDQAFPAATVPFSEKLGRVSQGMRVDSSFTMQPNQNLFLHKPGLYLVQYDTMIAEGLAIKAQDDYPRYAKIENLADPLIYICTRQEYERMKQAKGDKRAFDKIVISIARDADRARVLMKNYFRRVELANMYFTSYKEGWKTDRGMIFIVFGPPSEVLRFNDREVWNYDNASFKISFDFAKAPSVFDPENFVLLRNKKYTQTWYEVIDLWRNARF